MVEAITSGLYAAFLFARGRAEGLRFLAPDQAGALRSFWALPLTIPAAICMRLFQWLPGGVPANAGHVLSLDLAAFVVGWLGFAVLSFHAVAWIGATHRWPRFIAAWNWCNVIENLLLVFGSIPWLLGAPPVVAEAAQLVALGWALWVEWFAIRLSLNASGFAAAWLVLLDQCIGLLLLGLT